jgi:5-bromo-4-chloroindolyl phosphate hydrolysis protein
MPQNKQYTKEGVQKAVESGKLNDMGSYKELKESGLSDDQIIYLLNNLAQAPQRQAQYQALQRMA